MKKHSAGALSEEEKFCQDQRYRERKAAGVDYDYVFIGSGNAALTCATLLANQGYKVCMLEAHDRPGGYAHTFSIGDYSFCAQVHYTWGCGKGGRIYEFLKRLGLKNDITFELFDLEGYDHMIMPDGKRVKIPYGWQALQTQYRGGLSHYYRTRCILQDSQGASERNGRAATKNPLVGLCPEAPFISDPAALSQLNCAGCVRCLRRLAGGTDHTHRAGGRPALAAG